MKYRPALYGLALSLLRAFVPQHIHSTNSITSGSKTFWQLTEIVNVCLCVGREIATHSSARFIVVQFGVLGLFLSHHSFGSTVFSVPEKCKFVFRRKLTNWRTERVCGISCWRNVVQWWRRSGGKYGWNSENKTLDGFSESDDDVCRSHILGKTEHQIQSDHRQQYYRSPSSGYLVVWGAFLLFYSGTGAAPSERQFE